MSWYGIYGTNIDVTTTVEPTVYVCFVPKLVHIAT